MRVSGSNLILLTFYLFELTYCGRHGRNDSEIIVNNSTDGLPMAAAPPGLSLQRETSPVNSTPLDASNSKKICLFMKDGTIPVMEYDCAEESKSYLTPSHLYSLLQENNPNYRWNDDNGYFKLYIEDEIKNEKTILGPTDEETNLCIDGSINIIRIERFLNGDKAKKKTPRFKNSFLTTIKLRFIQITNNFMKIIFCSFSPSVKMVWLSNMRLLGFKRTENW